MKLRQHETGLTGCFMSPLTVIKVHSKNCIEYVIQTISTPLCGNCIEYCLIIGHYSLIEPIIRNSQIQDSHNVKWIGEHYCILSHHSIYQHIIPKAEILERGDNQFLLSLRGTKILIITHIKQFSSLQKSIIGDVHMVIICDNKYDPEDDPECIDGWTYHPNYPN